MAEKCTVCERPITEEKFSDSPVCFTGQSADSDDVSDCWQTGYWILSEKLRASEAEVARLKAELADVHALDAWAISGFARHWRSGPAVGGERHQCQAIDALNKLMCLEFAETPELARRAAVEWLKTRESKE